MGLFDLFKPAWMSSNYEKAVTAARNETDQYKLLEIAKKAPNDSVRAEAVHKLTDQYALAEFAKNDSHHGVRLAAVRRLTDQTALAYIAENDSDIDVILEAVEKLTDVKLQEFIKVALQSKYCSNGMHKYSAGVCRICKFNQKDCKFHEWEIIAKDIKVKCGPGYIYGRSVKCKKCGKTEDQPYGVNV